jgi:hypothetical protein
MRINNEGTVNHYLGINNVVATVEDFHLLKVLKTQLTLVVSAFSSFAGPSELNTFETELEERRRC